MKSNTLSLCIICKDEERNIKCCLDSIDNLVDEIVIVDTGSLDKTIDIAKYYTDKIYKFNWTNNFSDARNFSLEKATSDWILILDCDEILEIPSKKYLNHLLSSQHYDAYCLNLISENTSYPLCRLFRNIKDVKFKNKLHEQIVHCFIPSKVANCNLNIIHNGYTNDSLIKKNKINRNFNILLSYSPSEKDCFYFYNLGNCFLSMKKYTDALDNYHYALSIFNDPYGFFQNLINNIGECYIALERYDDYEFLKKSFADFI